MKRCKIALGRENWMYTSFIKDLVRINCSDPDSEEEYKIKLDVITDRKNENDWEEEETRIDNKWRYIVEADFSEKEIEYLKKNYSIETLEG